MTVQTIALKIPAPQAQKFYDLPSEKQEMLAFIIADLLSDDSPNLSILMDFIGYRAQKRGLTPDILEKILNEPEELN